MFAAFYQKFYKLPRKFNIILAAKTQPINNIKRDIICVHTARKEIIWRNMEFFTQADK